MCCRGRSTTNSTRRHPSTTIAAGGLDVMQAEAAATVAGTTGSCWWSVRRGPVRPPWSTPRSPTSSVQGRPVFGLAPTAKAARVLESETGMATDTVAKLLHEWQRTDRPPDPDDGGSPPTAPWSIDEAGMLATPATSTG